MKHEPECLYSPPSNRVLLDKVCLNCEKFRSAYQRGRNDAARAVNELYTVKVVDDGMADLLEAAISKASGKNEQ